MSTSITYHTEKGESGATHFFFFALCETKFQLEFPTGKTTTSSAMSAGDRTLETSPDASDAAESKRVYPWR